MLFGTAIPTSIVSILVLYINLLCAYSVLVQITLWIQGVVCTMMMIVSIVIVACVSRGDRWLVCGFTLNSKCAFYILNGPEAGPGTHNSTILFLKEAHSPINFPEAHQKSTNNANSTTQPGQHQKAHNDVNDILTTQANPTTLTDCVHLSTCVLLNGGGVEKGVPTSTHPTSTMRHQKPTSISTHQSRVKFYSHWLFDLALMWAFCSG